MDALMSLEIGFTGKGLATTFHFACKWLDIIVNVHVFFQGLAMSKRFATNVANIGLF